MRIALFFFVSITGFAKITPNVDAASPAYYILDRLEAFGCVKTTNRVLRPLAFAEVQGALKNVEQTSCEAPEWLLQERHLLTRPSIQSDLRLSLGLWNGDEEPLLGTESSVRKLFPDRQGRQALDGANLYAEVALSSGYGEQYGISGGMVPGLLLGLEDYSHANARFYIHEGYLKVGYDRAELTWGRVAVRGGDVRHGGVFLTSSAKPLDLLMFEIRPHLVGMPLSIFGPMNLKTFIAFDESSKWNPGTRYWVVEWSIRPWTFFEFGWVEMFQFGGPGRLSPSFSEFGKMLFYSADASLDHKRRQKMGSYFGIWGPGNYFKIYSQFFFQRLLQDVNLAAGIWFPKWLDWELRLEYHRTRENTYSDSLWTQGWTYEGTPLGSPLGNDGEGVYVDVGTPVIAGWRPEVGWSYELRNRKTQHGVSAQGLKRFLYAEMGIGLRLLMDSERTDFGVLSSWKYSFF